MAVVEIDVIHGDSPDWPTSGTTSGPVGYLPVNQEAAIPDPTAPATGTPTGSGGSFAAGAYRVTYTLGNEWGESLPAPLATFTLTSGQTIGSVTVAPKPGARWYRLYIETAPASGLFRLYVGGGIDKAYFNNTTTGSRTVTGPGTSVQPPSANTTRPGAILFGRVDDESGGVVVPISQAAPAWGPTTTRPTTTATGSTPRRTSRAATRPSARSGS
jgi:hypothetical protein